MTTITFVSTIADKEVYSRLSTYAYLINNQSISNDKPYDFPDMRVGYYIKLNQNTTVNSNLENYITIEQLNELLIKIKEKRGNNSSPSYMARGSFINNDDKIYYVCKTENNLNTYTIIFTDDTYSTELVKTVGFRINIIFFLIILVAVSAIYLWSNNFARRIQKIQNHILDLPKNKYEKTYKDDSLDEIGELSRSVELMREEINHNEKTKQEMLQNLSHDFKTPIAVIKSYAEAQQDGMAGEEATKVIISQAEILRKKVNRLLQYNSLEYLEKDKEFEEVSMNEIINEIVESYRYQTNLEFQLDLYDNISFLGYRENWYTVVDNIIDNAKRYAKTKIKIVLRDGRLRIYNDGEHIDEQFLNSIFKPYEKGSKGQFGLGMSIVKKTVNFFNYNLKVVNEEIGVSFIIEK
ncbi:MAG: sensor histidine kinase [Anaeroplasma sp.]